MNEVIEQRRSVNYFQLVKKYENQLPEESEPEYTYEELLSRIKTKQQLKKFFEELSDCLFDLIDHKHSEWKKAEAEYNEFYHAGIMDRINEKTELSIKVKRKAASFYRSLIDISNGLEKQDEEQIKKVLEKI